MMYLDMLSAANLTTLSSHREELSIELFCDISDPTSCMHQLLPV